MGQVLLVTLREGIEMFLIVAIAAAYLRKTGRAALLSAVTWGTGTAVLASVVLGVWLAEVAVPQATAGSSAARPVLRRYAAAMATMRNISMPSRSVTSRTWPMR